MKSRVDLKAGSSWFPQDPVQVSLSKRVPAGREGVCVCVGGIQLHHPWNRPGASTLLTIWRPSR